jgi:hypothetical protein
VGSAKLKGTDSMASPFPRLGEEIASRYDDRDLQTIRGFLDAVSRATASYTSTLSG